MIIRFEEYFTQPNSDKAVLNLVVIRNNEIPQAKLLVPVDTAE